MDLEKVDTEALKSAHPDVYEAWLQGRVRPYWLTHARVVAGRTLQQLEDDLSPSALQVEAGLIYPSWGFLCRFAVWAGADLDQLVGISSSAVPLPRPDEQPSAADPSLDAETRETFSSIEAGLRVRYHLAAIAHTLDHTPRAGRAFSFAAFQAGLGKIVFAASRAIGTQDAAGITREQVVADLDAGVAPETRILRARWAEELAPLHQALAEPSPHIDELLMFAAVSWMDPTITLTFAASTPEEEPGTVLVSIAGHHEHHGRVPLPHGEADLWTPVLFNTAQLPHVTYRGRSSGVQGPDDPIGILTTELYAFTPDSFPSVSEA